MPYSLVHCHVVALWSKSFDWETGRRKAFKAQTTVIRMHKIYNLSEYKYYPPFV
jgi:hypothetical protein